ncbi:hypothetical protein NE604_05145 [Anaerofustis stercorihominis]|uniref:PTS system, Lactose/Cellobiose specific IIB subunit n=1 Tax=Anaerofustis stercorihominis DSM 17244 TaxID=445971 RepID=B1CAC1_9FIRM|nr:hypothetical protein [Anaerofustis stercorihominis]EDS72632.1 PTS system, Lactose/Cellobiose specific IIB subunit [Anaerofustis stercorihominis DSM 17244]MCQ4795031.1 hypothetical protein [Anaerofustis stercorihominis]
MYNILSICGSGIATSTLVAERLKDGLEELGITELNIQEANVSEAGGLIQNNPPDIIIHTTSLESVDTKDIPSFDAVPILMNINTEPLYEQIAEVLNKK